MKAPLSWLKEYVDIDVSAEELEEKLFSCGFEVEELTYLGKNVEKVVVGQILSTKKHPDADRLTVCTVDCGEYGVKQICTAATNVFVGARVPCALDGATVLHEGGVQKIKTGKLRGELSEGMMCSGEELGIGDDFYPGAETNGILILGEEPLGEDIRKVVGTDDYIFDIAVTANRPDCQSIYGLAREVAAVLEKPLRPLVLGTGKEGACPVSVTVEEPTLCPLYLGSFVRDVKVGESPMRIRRRLALMGLRSVNNIVDITNYVLLEVGQPMHAFDRADLTKDEIVVRRAREGETITTLDEKQFTLTPDNLLICDGVRPVALAGVMGGANSGIREGTKEVFFEAAAFARDSVRKTSRALGQRSDSSARFEKGVYGIFPRLGMARAIALVEELGCGTPASAVVTAPAGSDYGTKEKKIVTSYEKIDALLGIRVPREEAGAILARLGFTLEEEGEKLTVTVPLWREDIDAFPDLAEEIVRMYGYEHIAPTFLENATVTHGGLSPAQKAELRFKQTLVGEGYFEAYGYSFYSPKDFDLLRLPADAPERRAVTLLNPIGEDLSVMRTLLAPTMVQNIVRNVRRGNEAGRLFELANVFLSETLPPKELPEERKHLSLGLWGEGDFFDLKGAVEAIGEAFGLRLTFTKGERPFLHPGATASIFLGEREVGFLGELHPAIAAELALEKKAYLAELDYTALSRKFRPDIVYRPVPKFPAVQRDLAVVVAEERTCAELEEVILRTSKAVKRAELFDVYRDARLGEGKKSMAFRLTFEADERAEKPLTPEAVDGFFQKIVSALARSCGAELR